MAGGQKLLIIQAAALGYDFMCRAAGGTTFEGLEIQKTESIFPALTCPVQASVRTGLLPCEHGMVMNGTYSRSLRKPSFWEQSSALVNGKRIWESSAVSFSLPSHILFPFTRAEDCSQNDGFLSDLL